MVRAVGRGSARARRGWIAGHDAGAAPPSPAARSSSRAARSPPSARLGAGRLSSGRVMSSTGTTISTSSSWRSRRRRRCATGAGRRRGSGRPRRAAAGRGRQADALRGARRRRRGRAAPATAPGGRRAWWAPARAPRRRSTVSTLRSVSRACEVSSRYSDSGVVIRMSGGCRAWACGARARRVAGAHGHAGQRPPAMPSRSAARAMPASGARRLRSTSYGQGLERRHVDHAHAGRIASPARPRPARPARRLASLLGSGAYGSGDRRTTGTRPASCRCPWAR